MTEKRDSVADRRRPLSPELIREAVKGAMMGYLATCSSGGMPLKLRNQIQAHVDRAADLDAFAIAIARLMDPKNAERADKEANAFFANALREIVER